MLHVLFLTITCPFLTSSYVLRKFDQNCQPSTLLMVSIFTMDHALVFCVAKATGL